MPLLMQMVPYRKWWYRQTEFRQHSCPELRLGHVSSNAFAAFFVMAAQCCSSVQRKHDAGLLVAAWVKVECSQDGCI